MKARKGDLILVERVSRDYVIGKEAREYRAYEYGVVASATRDGVVKTWRAVGYGDELVSEGTAPIRPGVNYWTYPAKQIDIDGVLRAAKAHHWPGRPGRPKPFDSRAAAARAALPFRRRPLAATR